MNLIDWPDCAPRDNDKRIAREFLLFLENYGFCQKESNTQNIHEKYFLSSLEPQDVHTLVAVASSGDELDSSLISVMDSRIAEKAEQGTITKRRRDPSFRPNVMDAYNSTCLFTGIRMPCVLEAAHIVPAANEGLDEASNGICLRSDIHLLFDAGHLRIHPDGTIYLSLTASKDYNYGHILPEHVVIPNFVRKSHLEWRWKYC